MFLNIKKNCTFAYIYELSVILGQRSAIGKREKRSVTDKYRDFWKTNIKRIIRMKQRNFINSWLLPCSLRSHRTANPRQKMDCAIFRLCPPTTLIQMNSRNYNTLIYTEFFNNFAV